MRHLNRIFRPLLRPFLIGLVCCCLVFAGLGSGYILAADQQATQKQLSALKKSINQAQANLKRDQKKQSSAENALAVTEQQISELGKQVYQLDKKLALLGDNLAGFEVEKSRLEKSLQENRGRLEQIIRQQYRLGAQPRLFMLLNQRDPEQISRMTHYYDRFSAAQIAEMAQYQALLRNLKSTHVSIDSTQQDIKDNRDNVQATLVKLQALRGQRQQSLVILKKQVRGAQAKLKQLQMDKKRLEKLLSEIAKSVSSANLTQNNKAFVSLKGKLRWPVKGKILRAYGNVMDNLSYDGVLLAGTTGSAVAAVHHGRVVFSDWLRGYGLLTIIDHGDGYMSLYGQNDSLLKETGDWVSQGESIATIGSSGGNNEPGLYFAIRHKGKAINPKRWFVAQ